MRFSIFSVNDHYPPEKFPGFSRTVADIYKEITDQAALADRLGYDTFFVAEHHFHEYGAIPNAAIMMAHLANHTQRIRVGSAISVLTLHNPLEVAENFAMVDVLSGGRLFLGVGSGYLKHEFEGYGIALEEKRDRFDENLEIVTRLLAGERLTYHGKHNHIDAVQLNVLPLQKPPMIAVAILRREAAFHVGRAGHAIISVPYASVDDWADVAQIVDEFKRGRAEAGKPYQPGDAVVSLHTHVAETDERARALAADPFDLYVKTRLYARRQTYDDILQSGLSLFGSVDRVVDKVVQLHQMGVDHLMTQHYFGGLAPEHVAHSMRLFALEVMPRVRVKLSKA
ncbi:LLM class flavin-dependent oxidoreductase [Comamonas badia]|uniref:LLM class flavin-dependent oxidoreductase n=1 Tax=Comamonas badia TaxID=265291 RepID=UPI0003F6E205|nr:LLM class flavin-dependent oxidoreductase [Comamonas badia]